MKNPIIREAIESLDPMKNKVRGLKLQVFVGKDPKLLVMFGGECEALPISHDVAYVLIANGMSSGN